MPDELKKEPEPEPEPEWSARADGCGVLTVSLHLLLLTQLLLLLHRLQPPQSRQVVSALDWRRIETRVHALTSCERDMREFPEGN